MYSLFWASKTLIMDFFSKRSLSCPSPFIQQSEYKRTRVIQTNTSELLVVPISDKEIQQPREVFDMFIWMSIPSTLSQPLHQSSENVSQKQNTEAIGWMWLQVPFRCFWRKKKKRKFFFKRKHFKIISLWAISVKSKWSFDSLWEMALQLWSS